MYILRLLNNGLFTFNNFIRKYFIIILYINQFYCKINMPNGNDEEWDRPQKKKPKPSRKSGQLEPEKFLEIFFIIPETMTLNTLLTGPR